eukprot:51358-Prorocentrum_minimum.AAC.1
MVDGVCVVDVGAAVRVEWCLTEGDAEAEEEEEAEEDEEEGEEEEEEDEEEEEAEEEEVEVGVQVPPVPPFGSLGVRVGALTSSEPEAARLLTSWRTPP